MNPYWSLSSLAFYLILAFVGMVCMNNIMKSSMSFGKGWYFKNPNAFFWIFVWTFFAVCRLVNDGVGGSDAIGYIEFFDYCLEEYTTIEMIHNGSDLLFRYINQAIRIFATDYHVLFVVIYSFLIASYILFLKKFSNVKYSVIPFILVFFLYLRSYSSIRSCLAGAFILMSLVALANKKTRNAYIWAICSAFIHKGALLYAMVIPFCQIFSRIQLRSKYIICMLAVSFILGAAIRDLFIYYTSGIDLQGAYASYAMRSKEDGFSNIISCFGQILLAIVLIVKSKSVRYEMVSLDENQKYIFYILWLVCLYDIVLIPLNLYLGIWRGYEFFYLPRLCMWSMLIYLLNGRKTFKQGSIIPLLAFLLFLFWFIFRLNRTYEASCLMPYIFEPLYNSF